MKSNFRIGTFVALVAVVTILAPFPAGVARAGDDILAWGDPTLLLPDAIPHLATVASGRDYNLGLTADGSVVAWGYNSNGQCVVPSPNTGFVAVAAGGSHSLGLKADGSIIGWGFNFKGQCTVPAPNAGFVAMAGGFEHSVGLKADGSIAVWGDTSMGQGSVPVPNAGFAAVAAGWNQCLVVRRPGPTAVYLILFEARRCGSAVAVHWTISEPRAHAGFHLWRQEPGQDRLRLSDLPFSGLDAYDFIDPAPPAGPAEYWLQEISTDGSADWYGPARLAAATIASALALVQNHPNPFNPRTTLSYNLPKAGRAWLAIYDLRGARVTTLVDGDLPAGEQSVVWDGTSDRGETLASGLYLARLETAGGVRTVKLALTR